MQNRRIIIEISPSRLEMALVRHSTVEALQLDFFNRTDWPTPWSESLNEMRESIARFVRTHKLGSIEAWIAVRSPNSTAGVSSAARSLPAWSAEQSAILALSSLADSASESAIHSTQVVAIDPQDAAAPMRHVLAIGDTDSNLSALQKLVEGTGLRVAGILPVESAAIVDSTRFVLSRTAETSAALWMGDHFSILAVGTGGNLKFVRTIMVGLESLADALSRPLRRPGAESPSLCVPRADARRLIAKTGFPDPHAPIEGLDGFTGSSILPMLQPLIQRLGVEIKQSLRYAASGAPSESVRVFVLGQGAGINGIANAIAKQTGLECSLGHTPASTDSSAAGAISVIASGTKVPALHSLDAQARSSRRSMRRAITVGLAATLGLMGLEWIDTMQAAESLRAKAAAANATQADEQVETAALAKATEDSAVITAMTARVEKALGKEPDTAGLLAAVADALPERVRLTGIEVVGEADQPRATVRGMLDISGGSDSAEALRSFVTALGKAPVVAHAKLGRTARTRELDREYQSFEISLKLIPVPSVSRLTLGSQTP